jgi:FdhD protein
MLLPDTLTIYTHRFSSAGIEQVSLEVSAEYSISILLNGQPKLSSSCSGSDLACLAVGRLISSGMLSAGEEVEKVDIDENSLSVNVITFGGDNIVKLLPRIHKTLSGIIDSAIFEKKERNKNSDFIIDPSVIFSAMRQFLSNSDTNHLTHGMHSAALFSLQGKALSFFNEIGRHNAVDKLLGQAMLRRTEIAKALLLCTGRVSGDIVQKACIAQIPVIATKTSTTSRAIELARNADIVLIAGVKDDSFYIHHGTERLFYTDEKSNTT